jgi:hypothetical protein
VLEAIKVFCEVPVPIFTLPSTSNLANGLVVPIPTFPLLVAKLAPVVLDNAPVTASPVEENAPRTTPAVAISSASVAKVYPTYPRFDARVVSVKSRYPVPVVGAEAK